MGSTADCAASVDSSELLTRARAGDTLAFCDLAAQCEARLLQQARGLTRDLSTAEDLVSETLIEAWRSLRRYDGTCRFSTWLFAILLHRHHKHLRRARSRPPPLIMAVRGSCPPSSKKAFYSPSNVLCSLKD